jgi:hypothetical protein
VRDRNVKASIDADPSGFERGMRTATAALAKFNDNLAKSGKGGSPGLKSFNAQVQRLAPTLQRVGVVATAMGAAITGAFAAAAVAAGAYADEVGDFAMTFGEAASDVRALRDVLGKADVGLQQFGNAAIGVVDRLNEARDGNLEAAAAFQRLGLSLNDLDGRSAIDVMGKVGDALRKIEDQQERIQIAKALGLSGRTLKAAIMAGGAGVEAQKQDPTFITDAQYEQLQKVSDALDELGVKASNTWKKAFAEAAPMIISLLGHLNGILNWIARFIDANPKLAGAVGMALAAFGGLMSVLGPLLVAIAPVVNMFTTLSGAGGVGGLVKGLTTAIPLLGKVGPALATIAPYAAVAVAAVGALALVWRDLKVAIEAATAAWDAYKTRQGTEEMLRDAGLSAKDAKRMARDDQAVDVSKMKRRGIREEIQAEQRRQAGLPALAAGGIVRKATAALVGEAGPEAVMPLRGFEQVLSALNRIAGIGMPGAGRPAFAGAGGGGSSYGPAVNIIVNGFDQRKVEADLRRLARQWGGEVQAQYGAA